MRSGQSSKGQMQMPMQPQGRMPTLDMKVPETQQLSVPRTNLPDSRQGIETPVRKLDLDGLIKTARENNPTLVQAHAQTLGEDGKAKEAGLWYNPVFSYDGSLIGVKSEGDALRAHTAGEFEGLNIQQRFVTAHKLGLSREKYQAREAAAQAEENVQALRVLNDVRIRYYQTLSSAQLPISLTRYSRPRRIIGLLPKSSSMKDKPTRSTITSRKPSWSVPACSMPWRKTITACIWGA